MTRLLHLGGLLVACGTMYASDQRSAAKEAPPRPVPVRPVKPPGNGVRRPVGAPMINPANVVTRLYRASPEERERALEKLPPKMQEQFRNQLKRFDSLTPEQQQLQLRWIERYSALPAERQAAFRQQFAAFQKLPPERRQPIAGALRRLESMPPEQRREILASDAFKNRFSADDLKMISDLSVVMLPQM